MYGSDQSTLLFVLKGSALNRGMNTGLENLAWGLAQRGLRVDVLSGGPQPTRNPYDLPKGVRYHFTGGTGSAGDHVATYRRLRERVSIDTVVGWIDNLAPLADIESANPRRPRFVANEGQLHGRFTPPGRRSRIRALVAKAFKPAPMTPSARFRARQAAASRMDSIVAISRTVRNNLWQTYAISPDACVVIPRGVNTQLFRPARHQHLQEVRTPPRLLFTGNITAQKGLGEVADALEQLRTPVELVLCGKDQGLMPHLQRRFHAKRMRHQLTWKGPLSTRQLVRQLQLADIFVFCSWCEGLGKSLLEAMSAGLPVVVSNISAFRELIRNQENGLIVPRGDSRSIRDAIDAYLSDPVLRATCAQNARETVIGSFTVTHELDRWLHTLHKDGHVTPS